MFISKTLTDEAVGLKENDEGEWEVYYGPVYLGAIGQKGNLEYPQRQNRVKRSYKEPIY